VVLVDSPGFNFRIGPRLHRLGIRTFYYIAPQVWAWHAERAQQMSRWVDRLAVVFPFEEELFRSAGVDARFVGHPLIEDLAPEQDGLTLRASLGLDSATRLIGLLPGSRPGELRAHLPVMVETARALCAARPGLVALVAVAPGLEDLVPAALREPNGPVRAVSGRTHAIQAAADCCIVASGTATLETALFGTPLVVVYRTSRINYAIARRLVRLERIGLPNIVAGTDVAPERVQNGFTRSELEPILARWLDDPAARAAQRAKLSVLRTRLGGPGAGARAASLLAELL
jgi:lipid-A-disaccharide synthase